MSVYFTSLNSGSNGNCYYVGNDDEAVLIDCGLSCRETEKRLRRLDLSMEKVKALFISHEHGDHIKGLPVLAKKYNLPIYGSRPTLNACKLLPQHLTQNIQHESVISVGNLSVTAFSKKHDAADPLSFVLHSEGIRIGVFTDLGRVCDNLIDHFKECHAAFLEANYDDEMLEKGRYPIHLKNRIRGGLGHLSNQQALDLFIQHRTENLKYLVLSHLSAENNSVERVQSVFETNSTYTRIVVAGRYAETPVMHIKGTHSNPKRRVQQMELFT